MSKCQCKFCGEILPGEFFDLIMATEIKLAEVACICCCLEKARQILGSDFMFTSKEALTKLSKYHEYINREIDTNACTTSKK